MKTITRYIFAFQRTKEATGGVPKLEFLHVAAPWDADTLRGLHLSKGCKCGPITQIEIPTGEEDA